MALPFETYAGGVDNRQLNVVAHNRECLAQVRDDSKIVIGKRIDPRPSRKSETFRTYPRNRLVTRSP